jgi:hypothetical protein
MYTRLGGWPCAFQSCLKCLTLMLVALTVSNHTSGTCFRARSGHAACLVESAAFGVCLQPDTTRNEITEAGLMLDPRRHCLHSLYVALEGHTASYRGHGDATHVEHVVHPSQASTSEGCARHQTHLSQHVSLLVALLLGFWSAANICDVAKHDARARASMHVCCKCGMPSPSEPDLVQGKSSGPGVTLTSACVHVIAEVLLQVLCSKSIAEVA